MRQIIFAALSGALFGAGLLISQMTNPSKVLAFLDIFGSWDPSLAFVMGGALLVTLIGYHLVLKREAPLLGGAFSLPTRKDIDARLIGGAALFGVGWGLAGLCPGPALASLFFGGLPVLVFVSAMLASMIILRL
jgi:uncharacterized membrane protein YedE/YeeE